MKFSTYAIIVLLLITFSEAARIRKFQTNSRGNAVNCVYQCVMGFLSVLGGNEKLFTECSKVVKGWEVEGTNKKLMDSAEGELKPSNTVLQTVLKYLGKGIDIACKYFRADIEKWFESKLKKYRRYLRLFLQGKAEGLWDWVDYVKKKIVKVAVSIKDSVVGQAVKAIKDAAVKTASQVWAWVKKKCSEFMAPIMNKIEAVKAKFLAWLDEHPYLKALFNFAKCFIKNKGVAAIKTLIATVKSIVTTFAALGTPMGWVKLLINCICSYKRFIEAIKYIKVGLAEKDGPKKWSNYCKAAANIFAAMANA